MGLCIRANESSLSLFQLPSQCGYEVQTSWRDLSLMAQYDACHISHERRRSGAHRVARGHHGPGQESVVHGDRADAGVAPPDRCAGGANAGGDHPDRSTAQADAGDDPPPSDDWYVLPLLWRGTRVKVTCPVSQMEPLEGVKSSLCCSPFGMTVRVQGESVTEEPRINVGGEWTPLVTLAEQCDYTVDKHDEQIVIAVPYITCGISVKDGKYILSLEIGRRIYTLACPISAAEEVPIVYPPLADGPPDVAGTSTQPETGSLTPLPWIPPFYLAPPYYPHPTFEHSSAHPVEWDLYNPPTQPASDPEETLSLQDLPSVGPQPTQDLKHEYLKGRITLSLTDPAGDLSRVYPDKRQHQDVPASIFEKHKATTKGFPVQVESPHSQPTSHDFSPFYHYYHHPKIPLPGPAKDLDPGISELLWSTYNHNEFPSIPSDVQQFRGHKADSEQTSPPKTTAYPYTFLTNPKLHHTVSALNSPPPSELLPYLYYYYYYYPHIARGEAKRLGLLHAGLTEKANLTQVHAPPPSSHKHGVNLHINEPKPVILSKLDEIKRRSSSVTPAGAPPVFQVYPRRPNPAALPPPTPSLFSPGAIYDGNPYQYYYHPYYGYYMMYYKPERVLGTDGRLLPTSSETQSPVRQAPAHDKHQSTTPSSDSMSLKSRLLHPYYYHHQSKVVKDGQQQQRPPPGKGFDKTPTKSESQSPSNWNSGGMQWFGRVSGAGYPSAPLAPHSPLSGLYSYYAPQTHLHGPSSLHAGYDAKEKRHNEMRDEVKANPPTPGALPSGFGPVSDVDCTNHLGCCSHAVRDGTAGQYLVFGLPDSVVEPKLVSPVPSSESSNVSCTLQKLSSGPDVYIVPLDGCGVSKRVFGQTVVHLLEVDGLQSDTRRGSAHNNSPVRLLVGCISYPDPPGEVMFHLMDQPHLIPAQPTPAPVTVLRLSTDESFSSFHPEAHLPLSHVQERPVYAELSLLNPSEPDSVLLVHSCLAYTLTPYLSWILFYDGCPKQGISELLPSPDSPHTQRIKIINFPSLPLQSSAYLSKGGSSLLEDPKVYFLCLTEMCSSATGDCSISCTDGKL
ncbi:uncharacterized protein LOC133421568 [Cololabis saira]|uniref:uncharacterized protein LOC133421568 n=1 Tax=Cololabis saira TaxID=129043 RepID=UPI002AD3397E|nr:uncharacterized protein LOC133421568 [Cololabis saira]